MSTLRPSRSRRVARFLGRGLVVLAVIGLVGWFAATKSLDRTALVGSSYHRETDRGIAEATPPPPARGRLHVGWSSAPITPPVGTPTYGYGGRLAKGTTRIDDELLVHALALRVGDEPPLVVLTGDLCAWPGSLSSRVVDALGEEVARPRVYFGATHTHNGPGPISKSPVIELMMGAYAEPVVKRIVDQAAGAVRAAIAGLQPGRYREHSLDGAPFIYNRQVPDDPIDDELYVLEAEQASGAKLALVVFSAHATSISMDHITSSGDYPGALCRELIARGYDDAMFLAGETGQAGPALDGEEVFVAGTEGAYELGRRLADHVVEGVSASPARYRSRTSLRVLRSEVALPPWRFRVGERVVRPALAGWLLGQAEPRAFVHAVELGETVLIGESFEMSSVIGRVLKRRARSEGGRLILTSFNGDHGFYVIPDAYYARRDLYESGMTFFGPTLGRYLERVTARTYDAMVESRGAPR